MLKNKLIRNEKSIIRILDAKDDNVLCIDCMKQNMPTWIQQSQIASYQDCTQQELVAVSDHMMLDYDSLDKKSRRFAHERFTLIAGILPFIGNDKIRKAMISEVAKEKNISKQTIRHYLWLYLVYQDIAALSPKQNKPDKTLSQDEKNMRWALNKFFYTRHKNNLSTAYALMLKEKYCDQSGVLLPNYPTIHQFRYFYRKYNKLQTYYISRDGLKSYQRNNRPLLGDGVQEFAPYIGVGMLDSTICDIYLVDEAGNVIGRPILTACVDAYSSLCCGYSLSWEGGVYSLKGLMGNVVTDKVDWCKQFGISIQREDWDCHQLPAVLVTDMGSEYKSLNFEQIAELGVTLINLPPYRPELKGVVEKFFDLIQSSYKKHLKGKGVIQPDFQERGAKDYRKEACLTLRDFEKIILHCIIYYNCARVLESISFTENMISDGVERSASSVWRWGKSQDGANLISVSYDELMMTLLPRTNGRFLRTGLHVNKLRYKNECFTEYYLRGGEAIVAYNPDDTSQVWLIEDGVYTAFTLAESRFKGLQFSEAELIKEGNKVGCTPNRTNLQAQIDLAGHIEAIVNAASKHDNTNLKTMRFTRRRERIKTHIDYLDGGRKYE